MDLNTISTFTPYNKCYIHHWEFFTLSNIQVFIGYEKSTKRGVVTINMRSYYIPTQIITFKDCLLGIGCTPEEIKLILSQRDLQDIANLSWEDTHDKIDLDY